MTGDADLTGGHDQELAARKLASVMLQHGIEVFDLGLQVSSGKAKENDAGMGESLAENQLAEIAVGNQ